MTENYIQGPREFPELRAFMKESIMQHSSLPRVQRDLKGLREKWKAEKAMLRPFEDTHLLGLLPPRERVDHLVQLYLETFETIYRIIHIPSFWNEYGRFWEDPHIARPAFIVILLLMMATVHCISLKEAPSYIGDSSRARETAVSFIEASETWLRRQTNKHLYLGLWQIRCLLPIAKQANTVKKKETWTIVGNLVRQAMSSGFHRDPVLLGPKVSVFNQQMRRRLWATIVELDLQASIERGMPSALAALSSDTTRVSNIDDEDFNENSKQEPSQKPPDEFTYSSFLHVGSNSLPLRISLNTVLNDLTPHPSYDEVLAYNEQITEKLDDIPTFKIPDFKPDTANLSELPLALLDIQLRQYLILLHGPYARRAESNPRYHLSKITCFDASSRILDYHSKFVAQGNYALCVFRNDIFRAALTLCHNAYVSSTMRSKTLPPLPLFPPLN
ncbi:putative c6 zinc finger domain containing protein [Phaeomoniella chlamydospora]|uniref:Putative c6 zinc finger domain containing protein n=1 Tax=Phaeomoniella chlamydospora TaxID=158046 RepID=A0A0G2E179_PHACM|nr:putative c6 zinc finger domain containing protein [Phaeomoniella chlamydospora]